MGHESRAGVKHGTDGDRDDQMNVWCFPERQPSTEKTPRGVDATGDVIRSCRLRWHGHVERKGNASCVNEYTKFVVKGQAPVGRPKKT